MLSSAIGQGLIIYRGAHFSSENRPKALKYGLHLRSIRYVHYSSADRRRCMRVVRSQGRKRAAMSDFNYRFEHNQDRLAQDVEKISGVRRFTLNFYIDFDFDFYKSESSLDSQYTVHSDGEDNSDNELDLEIKSNNSRIVQKNKRTLKKIFKHAKRVAHLTLTFEKMDPNHSRALHYLPMLNLLEDCHIKIKIRAPTDILALRDLLSQAKRRNYWPNMKSMLISLRHSYNKENCTSRFIRFCKILQDIAEIVQDLPWIKIQLKIKYMWRLDKSAVLTLREALKKAQDQWIRLSLITDKPTKLEPLFRPLEEMKNLHKFSIRFDELSDPDSGQLLMDILKKIPSLRRLKVRGKDILESKKDQKAKTSAEKLIKSFDGLNQITSFSFREKNQSIDETLWSYLSNSILKLPQLQILILKTDAFKVIEMSPGLNGFLDFFRGLRNFHNLRIFTFDMYYPSYAQKINGSEIFKTVCEAFQNLKELQKLHFNYPWISSMNSDLEELTKVFPNLQRLERFHFDFAVLKFIEPVENDVFLKFCKAICCLKAIGYFSINLELEEIDNFTYEAALLSFKHLKRSNPFWRLSLGSTRIDEQVKEKLNKLTRQIYIWKK